MDIYPIWTAHNRPCSFFSIQAVHRPQIKICQALAILAAACGRFAANYNATDKLDCPAASW